MKQCRTDGRCPHGHRLFSVLLALLACSGCREDAGSQQAATASPPTQIVDSILPIEEEVARFKRTVNGDTLRFTLSGGGGSVAELVHIFMNAVAEGDSIQLRALLIDETEFINLYYPSSPFSRPPYRQSPAFVWFQFQQNSLKGMRRALQRHGGHEFRSSTHECHAEPEPYGESRLWRDCSVSWEGRSAPIRLFGSIIEHRGGFKFVSYANDL